MKQLAHIDSEYKNIRKKINKTFLVANTGNQTVKTMLFICVEFIELSEKKLMKIKDKNIDASDILKTFADSLQDIRNEILDSIGK